MEYLLLIVGFVFLIAGGEFLVKGAVSFAYRARISPLVVGMTIVSIGTSAPEMLVSVSAALENHAEIAIGNVIGSNIANIALVLGFTAIIFPIPVEENTLKIDWPAMVLATLLLFTFMYDLKIAWWEGVIMILLLIAFIYRIIASSRKKNKDQEIDNSENLSVVKSILYVFAGCIGLALGANWLLEGAVVIAENFGVSERIIGITIVAFGTSVPELVASTMAAFRKQLDVSIGNLIGSNIFNIMAILGVTSVVKDIPVNQKVFDFDMYWVLGVALLLFPLMYFGKKISRLKGVLLVFVYFFYIYLLF